MGAVTAFHVVTVVWGADFRQLFVDVCVPNQLTAGNVGALPPGSRYRVFTSPEDAEFLNASPALRQASELMPVDVIAVPGLSDDHEDRFVKMTACHSRALVDAATSDAALIFLSPDLVMSEGTFGALVRRHRAGARAVACVGIRVQRETFVAALRGRDGWAIPPRELVALALEHLHSFTRAHMIDGSRTAWRPTGVYWNVPGEGILARGFYLHPLMVDPSRRDVMPGGTIDQHYLVHACPDRTRIHVVTDSDELVVFEMSPRDSVLTETVTGVMSRWRAASVLSRCDDHQKTYWTVPLRVHTGDIGEAWRDVEEHAARFVRQVTWLRPLALWRHLASRRVRPVGRAMREFKKRVRRAAKDGRRMLRRARLAH